MLGVVAFGLHPDVYGTLLVDADPRPADRAVGWPRHRTVPAWLWTRRCRSGLPDGPMVYRQGVIDGMPDAVRVSDHFRRSPGLSLRVGDVAAARRGCLSAAIPGPEATLPSASPAALSDEADASAPRRAKPLFEAVHVVTDTGRSPNSAARELGRRRRTVTQPLGYEAPPIRTGMAGCRRAAASCRC